MVYDLWSMVYGLCFMVYGLWSMISGLWSIVYGLWSIAYGLWSMDEKCVLYVASFMMARSGSLSSMGFNRRPYRSNLMASFSSLRRFLASWAWAKAGSWRFPAL